jgi:hypothetical protein
VLHELTGGLRDELHFGLRFIFCDEHRWVERNPRYL